MSPWYWAKQKKTLPVNSSFQAILDDLIWYKALASGANALDPFRGAYNAPQTPSCKNARNCVGKFDFVKFFLTDIIKCLDPPLASI